MNAQTLNVAEPNVMQASDGSVARVIVIPAQAGLDPITVCVFDYQPGRGKIIIECFSDAWCAFFNGMGGVDVREFIGRVDADYLANRMRGSMESKGANRMRYLRRVAQAVIIAMKARMVTE